ncbi:MAG TPA: 3-methyl-2-oxobutanoate hydroxymethyltransferase, partial [Vampirovibrionales bacterium]
LTEAGIPVIGHLGYTPQAAGTIGTGKIQGKTQQSAQQILEDAKCLEEHGAIAIVLELVPANLSQQITEALKIPTIGIGAGPGCDGQILVTDDMLGKTSSNFKFLKKFANIKEETQKAFELYIKEVSEGRFPSSENSF